MDEAGDGDGVCGRCQKGFGAVPLCRGFDEEAGRGDEDVEDVVEDLRRVKRGERASDSDAVSSNSVRFVQLNTKSQSLSRNTHNNRPTPLWPHIPLGHGEFKQRIPVGRGIQFPHLWREQHV